MPRLLHSYGGYHRSMQLLSTDFFIFVEGKQSDSFFYAQVCETLTGLESRYEICLAQQLPGGTGGKKALIGFFEFLRKQKKLVSSLSGQRTTCIFFVDKDVDDLQHKKRRSRHFIYTEHYDVQNYIFLHGNLRIGAASAASIAPACLNTDLNDARLWCMHVAKLWREWVSLCLCMLEDGISCEANYRVLSRVQERPSGPTDALLYKTITRNIARKNHVPVAVLREKLATTNAKVDRYYKKGLHHRIFKGKWFSSILADEIDKAMAGRPYDSSRLASRIPSSIAATLNFGEQWAGYFRDAVLRVNAML